MKIVFENVSKSYGEQQLLSGFNFTIDTGITCLLGSSGVGKTTLLKIIAGLTDYQGQMQCQAQAVSYVFQEDRLIPSVSVYSNLELVLLSYEKDKLKRKNLIDEVLKTVELSAVRDKLPSQLSGGERQRISMARAFLYPAEVLLMDEPFKALDLALKNRLIESFLRLYSQRQKTVVFVTHDIFEAVSLADRIAVLKGAPLTVAAEYQIDMPQAQRHLFSAELAPVKEELFKQILS